MTMASGGLSAGAGGNIEGRTMRFQRGLRGATGRGALAVRLAVAAATAVAAGGRAVAAELRWDADGAGSPNGGTGNWDTTLARWWTGSAYRAWDSAAGDTAAFVGIPGVVTAQGVRTRGLRFEAGGFELAGALTLGAAGGAAAPPTIDAPQGATVSASLAGASGLAKRGAGTLVLSGENTYVGDTVVSSGRLVAASPGAIPIGSRLVFTLTGSAANSFAAADGVTARVPEVVVNYSGLPTTIGSAGGVIELARGITRPAVGATPGVLEVTGTLSLPAGDHAMLFHGREDEAGVSVFRARVVGPGVFRKTGPGAISWQGAAAAASTADLVLEQGTLRIDGPAMTPAGVPPAAAGPLGTGTLTFSGHGGRLLGALHRTHPAVTNPVVGQGTVWVDNLTVSGPVVMAGGSRVRGSATFAGPVSAPAGSTLTFGRYDFNPVENRIRLTAANRIDGAVTVEGATLTLGHPEALGTGSSPIHVNGAATLELLAGGPIAGARPLYLNALPDPVHGDRVPTLTGSGVFDTAVTVSRGARVYTPAALTVGSLTSQGTTVTRLDLSGRLNVRDLSTDDVTVSGTLALSPSGIGGGPAAAAARARTLSFGPWGPGQFDLSDRALVIDYPLALYVPMRQYRADVIAGRNGGGWTGAGITSSAAAADAAAGRATAVGYAEASNLLNLSAGQTAVWMGRTVDHTSVLMRYTLAGDANLDGAVDFADLVRLAQNYDRTLSGTAAEDWWYHGDFTYDGIVGFADLVTLAQNYEASLAASAAPAGLANQWAAAVAAVPEPGGAGAVLGGVVAALGWRRRRV
jgi:autotransporter-associated beta strand protein